jgi:Family of unknown function (DUF6455)
MLPTPSRGGTLIQIMALHEANPKFSLLGAWRALMAEKGRKTNYLGEMMQRLGIDPASGVLPHFSLSYMTALHRCQACSAKESCRHWLDSTPMSTSFAPQFCPNADILFELQIDKPDHT